MKIRSPKILIVDNYDSFTYNLVQIFREHGGCSFAIMKNDEIIPESVSFYDAFLFSPGPGVPSEAPVMADLLRLYVDKKSFLGICLGHQAIAQTYGAELINMGNVHHGEMTRVRVTDREEYLFSGLEEEFDAGLYHSWSVKEGTSHSMINPFLRITARSSEDLIMAIRHIDYDIGGVQFHPESFMTLHGKTIIHNWIRHISLK